MVLLIILAVIIIILHFPLNVYVSFIGGKPAVRVKYVGITLFDLDKAMNKKKNRSDDEPDSKKRKKSKKDNKKDKALKKRKSSRSSHENGTVGELTENEEKALSENSDTSQSEGNDTDEKPKKKKPGEIIDNIKDKLELVKLLWRLCGKNIKKILKDIRFDNIFIDFTAAAEDAHKAALLYGKLNAAVYNGVAFFKQHVKMSIKSIGIRCRYDIEKPVFDCSVRINIRPAVMIGNAFVLIFKLLVNLGKILPLLRSESDKDKTEEAKEKITK